MRRVALIVGAGDATKCVNNVLNAAHLLLATEGMLALKAYGVDPATASGEPAGRRRGATPPLEGEGQPLDVIVAP